MPAGPYTHYLLVGCLAIPVAAIGAVLMEGRRRDRDPDSRPYAWGYFQGLGGIVAGIAWTIATALTPTSPDSAVAETTAVAFLLGLVYVLPGYYVLRRRRWAWIVLTLASANVVAWIINGVYGKNRWAEFKAEAAARRARKDGDGSELSWVAPVRTSRPSRLHWISVGLAVAVAATAAWALWKTSRPVDPIVAAREQMGSVLTVIASAPFDKPVSLGTGFVVGDSGLCITNYHVIAGYPAVEAILGDQRRLAIIEITAFDSDTDLCAFRLGSSVDGSPARDLTALHLKQKGLPFLGERIAVIGSPKGLDQSLSDGIVSALRTNSGQSLIQFTAPVSPGSSGGPVIDGHGLVIGIVTLQMNEGQNLNFAIPASEVGKVLEERQPRSVDAFYMATQARYLREAFPKYSDIPDTTLVAAARKVAGRYLRRQYEIWDATDDEAIEVARRIGHPSMSPAKALAAVTQEAFR